MGINLGNKKLWQRSHLIVVRHIPFMKETILGKKLLIVVAHPDDESFLAAGTIHANHIAGGENHIFCASLGERGFNYLQSKTPIDIKKIRKSELLKVSKYLKINRLKVANFPDGSILSHINEFEKNIKNFIQRSNPDYIISFGNDGYTGHKDHIVVGEVTKKLSDLFKIPFVRFCKPSATVCEKIDDHLTAKRRNGVYAAECLEKEKANIKIKIDPVVKLKALSMHESQFEGLNPHKIFPKKIANHVLRYEYFYLSN